MRLRRRQGEALEVQAPDSMLGEHESPDEKASPAFAAARSDVGFATRSLRPRRDAQANDVRRIEPSSTRSLRDRSLRQNYAEPDESP